MIVVEKGENNVSNERLIRDFTRKVRNLSLPRRVKSKQVRSKTPNKRMLRKKAVRAARVREERELLIKKGKIQPRWGRR